MSCEFSHAGKGGAAAKGAAAKGAGKKRQRSKSVSKKKGKGKGAVALALYTDQTGYVAFAPDSGSDLAPDDSPAFSLPHRPLPRILIRFAEWIVSCWGND